MKNTHCCGYWVETWKWNSGSTRPSVKTKYNARTILHTETDGKCKLCQQFDDTIDHITSACPILAKEQYIKGHDRVCAQLHFNIYKEIRVKLDKQHCQEGKATILWN
jgi:hypothetical protein